jgi:excisionase family DNA binding protein
MNLVITTPDELSRIVQSAIRTALTEQATSTNKNSNANEFLSIDEAAKFLKIPKASLYQLTSKREIPFVKRSRRNFFKISDLEAWQEEGRKKTRTEIEQEAMQEMSKGGLKR